MQCKLAIQINPPICSTGRLDSNGRPEFFVRLLRERSDNVESIRRPAQKYRNQDLLLSFRCGRRASKPPWYSARTGHYNRGSAKKISTGQHRFTSSENREN